MLSLDQISDSLEIEDLLTRYCYAVDDRDWNAYRNVFTADATIDDTVTGGVRGGVEEHIVYMRMSASSLPTTSVDRYGMPLLVRSRCGKNRDGWG